MRKLSVALTSLLLVGVLFLIMASTGILPKTKVALSPRGPKQILTPFTSERTEKERYLTAFEGSFSVYNPVGKITVAGADVEQVELQVTKKARALTLGRINELLQQILVEINTEKPDNRIIVHLPKTVAQEEVCADLHLTVPSESVLDLYAGLGNIEIKQIRGALQVHNDLGSLRIRNFAGKADLFSSLGSIDIQNSQFFDELTITARLGSIFLAGSLAETTVLKSELGDIEILLPENESYLLEGTINLGGFSSRIPFQGRKTKESVEGIIGSGEQRGTLFVHMNLGSLSFGVLE